MSGPEEKVVQICAEVIAPIVQADGGELFVVSVAPDCVTLHLAGKCAGCPGSNLTSSSIIEPAIHSVAPGVRVVVTSGYQIPPGAYAV
ncbi:MAG TPA: NifU family protein, partial [Polyangiaceae bacterium]